MTPAEKAKEIFDNHFFQQFIMEKQTAKIHALITARELLKNNYTEKAFVYSDEKAIYYTTYTEYYAEVLIEISKL